VRQEFETKSIQIGPKWLRPRSQLEGRTVSEMHVRWVLGKEAQTLDLMPFSFQILLGVCSN
jgi:hypothetical protein